MTSVCHKNHGRLHHACHTDETCKLCKAWFYNHSETAQSMCINNKRIEALKPTNIRETANMPLANAWMQMHHVLVQANTHWQSKVHVCSYKQYTPYFPMKVLLYHLEVVMLYGKVHVSTHKEQRHVLMCKLQDTMCQPHLQCKRHKQAAAQVPHITCRM